jgi:hypothetical protein
MKVEEAMAESSSTNKKLVRRLTQLLKDVPVEVLGHIESSFACCNNGTVAIVKFDEDVASKTVDPKPSTRKKAK